MSKIKQILSGWGNLLKDEMGFLDKETKDMSTKRLLICNNCPIRTENVCDKLKGGCGCPIIPKSLSPESDCPKGYWV